MHWGNKRATHSWEKLEQIADVFETAEKETGKEKKRKRKKQKPTKYQTFGKTFDFTQWACCFYSLKRLKQQYIYSVCQYFLTCLLCLQHSAPGPLVMIQIVQDRYKNKNLILKAAMQQLVTAIFIRRHSNRSKQCFPEGLFLALD